MSKLLSPTLKSVSHGNPQEKWSEDLDSLCNQFMRDELNSNLSLKRSEEASVSERANGARTVSSGLSERESVASGSSNELNSSDLSWVSRQTEKSLLDKNRQKGTWSRKQKRTYSGILSGVYRYHFKDHGFLFHLSLTSKYHYTKWQKICHAVGLKTVHVATDKQIKILQKSWKVFILQLRRDLNEEIPFYKVITREGGGVIHAVMRCDWFRKWRFADVHCYLKYLWSRIHGSPNIWFRKCFNSKKLARYVVSQYVAGNDYVHAGHSRDWCFWGFRKKFMELVKRYHFPNCLRHWHTILKLDVLPSFKYQSLCVSFYPKS